MVFQVKIYNTYTRKKEDFKPIEENKIKMYVCGPTVYDYIHIGNARPVLFFDVVRRYFEFNDYKVDYVSNITDVDDKIINKAQAEGVSETEIADKYLAQYLVDCEALNVQSVRAMPRVTENMAEIVAFIDALVQDGFAYVVEGDVYFRVKKAADYGKLSGKKVEDLMTGARVEANTKKEDPLDFTLWKKTNVGITWDSPWGLGRPGWHTECVVMINEAFGGKIDIHGGGSDLQFPHHENEIAQSMCSTEHSIANTWMHVGRIGLDDEKMSKSLGNVVWVKDLLIEYDANVFRLFMLSTHYRQPINFSYEVLESAQKEWEKVTQIYDALFVHLDLNGMLDYTVPMIVNKEMIELLGMIMEIKKEFTLAMEDDFNTANAMTAVYAMVKLGNKFLRAKEDDFLLLTILNAFEEIFYVLGFKYEKAKMSSEDKELYKAWEQARVDKNFKLADELRSRLQERELI